MIFMYTGQYRTKWLNPLQITAETGAAVYRKLNGCRKSATFHCSAQSWLTNPVLLRETVLYINLSRPSPQQTQTHNLGLARSAVYKFAIQGETCNKFKAIATFLAGEGSH
jgi:hypothetical protein